MFLVTFSYCLYFNPRSHERSDDILMGCNLCFSIISIHAPTRGATVPEVPRTSASYHFNPRSHERSDSCSITGLSSLLSFQSTLPREERRVPFLKEIFAMNISIHAPTRGATTSTLPVASLATFQSTLPREERRILRSSIAGYLYFNPRSHERSDPCRLLFSHASNISIHAPTRGATAPAAFCIPGPPDFNPRSHERSDLKPGVYVRQERISIHAPTRGATAILHKKFVYFYTIPTINI